MKEFFKISLIYEILKYNVNKSVYIQLNTSRNKNSNSAHQYNFR